MSGIRPFWRFDTIRFKLAAVKTYAAMRFAVRPSVVAKLLTQLYALLAVLTLIPAAVATAAGNWPVAHRYALVIGVLTTAALAGRWLPDPNHVQRNEAMVVVALLFFSASLLMAIPMMGYGHDFVDAWFEATSGVTTTGLSTLTPGSPDAAFLFSRGWLQWVGGIGVVVLALALVSQPSGAAKKLGFSNAEMGDQVGGTRAHAKRVIVIYVGLTALGFTALWLSGASALDALVHCMTAVSTGGFANYQDSLASVTGVQLAIINLLCVAGAVSFHVYYMSVLTIKRGRDLDSQLYMLLAAISLATAATWLLSRMLGDTIAFVDLGTLIVSAQTTAGFATVDLGSVPAWLILCLIMTMLVGGGLGSTSGGIKLGRALVVLRRVRLMLVRSAMPDRVVTPGSLKGMGALDEVLTVITLYLVVLLVSWIVFVTHGYAPLDSLFEVASALATAGLSIGVTSETLPASLKVVLCFDMLFGRVEGVALLVALWPRTWVGRRRGLGRSA